MKISEIIEELKNRPETAQLFVVIPEMANHPLQVESIAKHGLDETVIMVAQSTEALCGGKPEEPAPLKWAHNIDSRKSETGDKYELIVDGDVRFSGIETEHDAKMCMEIFAVGVQEGMSTQINFLRLRGDQDVFYFKNAVSGAIDSSSSC